SLSRCLLPFAGDAHRARPNSYFQFLFAEPRHISADRESGLRLRDIYRNVQENFRCRLEPIFTIVAIHGSPKLKQLVGATRDQITELLREFKECIARIECA